MADRTSYPKTGQWVAELICRWRGHRMIKPTRTDPVYVECIYRAVLTARCKRCGWIHKEYRWGFVRDSGSLTCIDGYTGLDSEIPIVPWAPEDLKKAKEQRVF